MDYIARDIERKLLALSQEYACILLTGPRQVGKTTLFRRLMGEDRGYVTLDDLEERALAVRDPAFFLQMHRPPLLIDEVQYAPQIFSYIKIAADQGAAPGSFWLTGSQVFRMMELAQESLAGRVALLQIPSLSQHELYGEGENVPFTVDLDALRARARNRTEADVPQMYDRIWRGSMPALASGKHADRDVYYSSYIKTYIERDVSEQIELPDRLLFRDFIRAAACRVAQVLNIHDIASDVGVPDETARRWLRVLEGSGIVFYLRPYSNNLLKRTLKTPKLYFFDTGVAAYLTRYPSPEILQNGALAGAILENYAVAEIMKTYQNDAKECFLWYYRDKDNREVDMVLESNGELHPLEVKRSIDPGRGAASAFGVLDRGSVPRGRGAVLCLRPQLSAVDERTLIVPIWMI